MGPGRLARRTARRPIDQREGPGRVGGRAGLRCAHAGGLRRRAGPAVGPGDHQQPAPHRGRELRPAGPLLGHRGPQAGYDDLRRLPDDGLTGTYYELVLDISKEAKRLRKTATQEQTLAFVAEEAKRRCAKAATTCTTTASYNGFPSC